MKEHEKSPAPAPRHLFRGHVVRPLPWRSWMAGFLADLERTGGNAIRAAELSPKARATIYRYRERNAEFRRRWDEILEGRRPGENGDDTSRLMASVAEAAKRSAKHPAARRRKRRRRKARTLSAAARKRLEILRALELRDAQESIAHIYAALLA